MGIWVAVLPRVDQLKKLMPNFWRAVYMPIKILYGARIGRSILKDYFIENTEDIEYDNFILQSADYIRVGQAIVLQTQRQNRVLCHLIDLDWT